MHVTRVTRFLPRFTGINAIQRCWQRFSPGSILRIDNFDHDLKLDVCPAETIGVNLWHIPQLYEPAERRVFCSALTPGCTVLDVGANIGIYTLLAAKRGARVFSIEADPHNVARLRSHVALNGLTATIYAFAAMDKESHVALRRNPNNCGGSAVIPGAEIHAATIDSLHLPPIDVCKMDIEGSELKALRGMSGTIRRSPNMRLLIEYNALSDRPALMSCLRSHFNHIKHVGQDSLWCY